MQLDDDFADSIVEVGASFGFSRFACDPEEISRALGLEADEVRWEGEARQLSEGHTFRVPFSSWHITSGSTSKDVNDHLRELLARLAGAFGARRPEWGVPSFNILYKATHLHAGNGPFFEAEVLKQIASHGAELWQDIYALDENEAPGSPPAAGPARPHDP